MADVKISALPAATTPLAGTEVLPIVQSSTTKKVAISDVTAGRAISASSLTLTTPLSVANGGTGLTSLTAGYIPYGNGTGAFGFNANLVFDGSNKLTVSDGTTNTIHQSASGTGILGTTTNHPLVFFANNGEKARIISSGQFLFMCQTALTSANGENPFFQANGTDSRWSLGLRRFSNNAGGVGVFLGKSRGATVGDYTAVLSGDQLGRIEFSGADGTNLNSNGCAIYGEVDGAVSTGVVPGRLSFFTNTAGSLSEKMRIASDGTVSIGTTSTGSYRLDVVASNTVSQLRLYGTTGTQLEMWNAASDTASRNWALLSNQLAYGDFGIYQSNALGGNPRLASTARMYLDTSGNLLVGTTSSNGRLTIKTAASATGTGVSVVNSSGTPLFTIREDGVFYTGTATNSPYNLTTASAANVVVDSFGALLRSTSSRRYKINIVEAVHGLSDLQKLRSVTYNGINDGDKVFGGLIAEEVDAAGLTEFVVYDSKGRPDALHYGNMAGLFVKAIQELAAKVQALEAKVQ